MTDAEAEDKKNLNDGDEEEEEEEEDEESEEEFYGELEEDEESDLADDEFKTEVDIKPIKKRRCQKRRKIHNIDIKIDDEEKDLEGDENEGEEGEEEAIADEEEEPDVVSYTSSVLSAISFVWENEVYEFEELCDLGNIEKIYRKHFVRPTLPDDVGVYRYFEVCRYLNITPNIRIINSLNREEIDLSYRNVHSKSIRAMCAALESNTTVKTLTMRYNKLKQEDCYYIGLILNGNESLTHLNFTGCRVGPEGLELLIANLPTNEYLLELNLSKCSIGDTGMKMLSYVLTRNNSIQKLDLSYNKLGDESAAALAVAFKMNSSVTSLVLRYNNLFEPSAMKAFFRSLTFNNSISYLDLSWNGLSGAEMGGYIKNYIRRSGSIEYLDLSDNRFEGAAAVELKVGLAKSRTLETLKLGKNPLSPEDLDLILNGANGSYKLKVLDLEDLWVNKSFLKILQKVQKQKEIEVNYAGVLGDYEVYGPDYPKVILERAQFEAQKPKQQKKKRDFGHLMWILGDEPITQNEFMTQVKKFKAKVSKELYPELIKQFTIPKAQLIDVVAMRQKYLSIFPDSTPPPPSKSKKGAKVEELKVEEVVEEKASATAAKEAAAGKEALGAEEDLEEEEDELEIGGEFDDEEYIIWGEEDGEFFEDEEGDEEIDEYEDEEDEEEEDEENDANDT